MPCQWIELVTGRVLRTRRVTVSPSRQRRIGAGSWRLTTIAGCARPVKSTGMSPMVRSNSVPLSTAG